MCGCWLASTYLLICSLWAGELFVPHEVDATTITEEHCACVHNVCVCVCKCVHTCVCGLCHESQPCYKMHLLIYLGTWYD